MKAELSIAYGLAEDSTYFGHIWIQVEPTRGRITITRFEGISFEKMLCDLSELIKQQTHEITAVQMSRHEVVGSMKRLSQKFIEELLQDPAAVAKALTYPDVTIHVGKKTALRVGVESLADAFGDRCYLRRVDSDIECPECGAWAELTSNSIAACCGNCGAIVCVTAQGTEWVYAETAALLEWSVDRFYLPRYWNPSRQWISKEELQAMYALFQKEKEECKRTLDGNSE